MVEGAVRAVSVVVIDVVGDEALKLALVLDDCAVEELAAEGSYPAFGERVRDWRPDWGLEDLEALGAEDFVEGVDELAASISNECSVSLESVGMSEEEFAGCLGGPWGWW